MMDKEFSGVNKQTSADVILKTAGKQVDSFKQNDRIYTSLPSQTACIWSDAAAVEPHHVSKLVSLKTGKVFFLNHRPWSLVS